MKSVKVSPEMSQQNQNNTLAKLNTPPVAQARSQDSDGMVIITQGGDLVQIDAYDTNVIRPRFYNYLQLQEYDQAAELAINE